MSGLARRRRLYFGTSKRAMFARWSLLHFCVLKVAGLAQIRRERDDV